MIDIDLSPGVTGATVDAGGRGAGRERPGWD